MRRFKLKGDVIVNMYFTKAGHMRSGDLHNCNQYDIVLKGRVRLTMKVGVFVVFCDGVLCSVVCAVCWQQAPARRAAISA